MEVIISSFISNTLNAIQGINKPLIVKIKEISNEIQTIARDYKESRREGDFKIDIKIIILLCWKQIIDVFFDISKSVATVNSIMQIFKNTEEIKKWLKTPPKQTALTWN